MESVPEENISLESLDTATVHSSSPVCSETNDHATPPELSWPPALHTSLPTLLCANTANGSDSASRLPSGLRSIFNRGRSSAADSLPLYNIDDLDSHSTSQSPSTSLQAPALSHQPHKWTSLGRSNTSSTLNVETPKPTRCACYRCLHSNSERGHRLCLVAPASCTSSATAAIQPDRSTLLEAGTAVSGVTSRDRDRLLRIRRRGAAAVLFMVLAVIIGLLV